jgi:hypothetical protein
VLRLGRPRSDLFCALLDLADPLGRGAWVGVFIEAGEQLAGNLSASLGREAEHAGEKVVGRRSHEPILTPLPRGWHPEEQLLALLQTLEMRRVVYL